MSKYNTKALKDTDAREKTRAWVSETSPLIYIFAPSKVGKTTLLGSLLRHPDYQPVLFIDGDTGGETVSDRIRDPRVCIYEKFKREPEEFTSWFVDQLQRARTAKCSAIIIEGLADHHQACVTQEVERLTAEAGGKAPTGQALWGAHRPAATYSGTLIRQIKALKQARSAKGTGVPIFVSLNTKERQRKGDEPPLYIPDWSNNCIERSMRTTDAHLELTRSPNGTQLFAIADVDHPYAAMRNAAAAEKVQRQRNLSLPGLLALWATTVDERAAKFQESIDKYYGDDTPEVPNPND